MPWILTCSFFDRFVGEWYHPEEGMGAPTPRQIDEASKNCFAVGGIYIGFTVMAIALTWHFNRKAKSS